MFNTYVLKNGLRVVTEKADHLNSVSVGVMVQNGSRNETDDLNGISHFIEHMFFKGTKNRNAKEIMAAIEDVGGQINAFTSKESTCYYVKSLSTHLDLALEILSDILLNSTFNEEEIEKEKGVVIEEINMNQDSPEDVLDDAYSKAAYGNNSLGNPILGTESLVRSFTRQKIVDFIKEKYTPYNSVISICGKFDDEELKNLIEKYFGNWHSDKEYKVAYPKTELQKDAVYVKKEIEQLHISLGLKGLPYADKNMYSLILLNNIFGGGASSILFQNVREQLGLCYTIYSYVQSYQGIGNLIIYAGLNKNCGEKALEVIKRETIKFADFKINDHQLETNKEKIKANYILGLESTSSRMFTNAKTFLFQNRVKTQEEVIKAIDAVSKESVQEILDTIFKEGIINAAYTGPEMNYNKFNDIVFGKDVKAFKNNGNKTQA